MSIALPRPSHVLDDAQSFGHGRAVGEGGWQIEGFTPPKDIGAAVPSVPIYIYHGREDEIVPFAHVDLYASALSRAFIRRLHGRNHQLNDDLSEVATDIRSLNASHAS